MKNKTIWYCHHYAGAPSLGMSYRPYYFTREFQSLGHNAYIISANHHHLLHQPLKQEEPVVKKCIDEANFIQLKTRPYQGNGLGRILNMLSYAYRIKRHVKDIIKITGKPDVIIVSCSHLFHYPILERIARKYNAELIFEVRDLWPLSLIELLRISPFNPLVLWLAQIERRAYRNTDKVVSLLDAALPYMKSKGLTENRFHVIPNGTNIDLFHTKYELSKNLNDHINVLQDKNLFLLGYAGALGGPNAMSYLIEAMAILAEKNLPIHIVIVGEGAHKGQLEQEVTNRQLTNVSFLPAISKYEIPAFLNKMDALYLGWNASEIYKYGVSPNKIFDYMMAGKPIIESGSSKEGILKKFKCGIQCEASKPDLIAEAIITMSKKSLAERERMGELGQKAVEEFYNYKVLAQQYARLFD